MLAGFQTNHSPIFSLLSPPVAMSHLNGQKVFGKVMRVTLSKHQTVALPREGLDDQLLTKGERLSASWNTAGAGQSLE